MTHPHTGVKEVFLGRSYGKIKGRTVYVPSMFAKHFRGPFHVYARQGKYLRLVVEAPTEFPGKEDETYVGTAYIDVRKYLHLTQIMKDAIYSPTCDIVIIGAGEALEIWKSSAYMEEMERDREIYRNLFQDLMEHR